MRAGVNASFRAGGFNAGHKVAGFAWWDSRLAVGLAWFVCGGVWGWLSLVYGLGFFFRLGLGLT